MLPPSSLQPWRWRQHGSPKRWYPTTTLHGVTTQKTTISTRISACLPLYMSFHPFFYLSTIFLFDCSSAVTGVRLWKHLCGLRLECPNTCRVWQWYPDYIPPVTESVHTALLRSISDQFPLCTHADNRGPCRITAGQGKRQDESAWIHSIDKVVMYR